MYTVWEHCASFKINQAEDSHCRFCGKRLGVTDDPSADYAMVGVWHNIGYKQSVPETVRLGCRQCIEAFILPAVHNLDEMGVNRSG